jgi:hypothetical protein
MFHKVCVMPVTQTFFYVILWRRLVDSAMQSGGIATLGANRQNCFRWVGHSGRLAFDIHRRPLPAVSHLQSRGKTGQSRGRIWECFRQHEIGARIAPFALAQCRLGAVVPAECPQPPSRPFKPQFPTSLVG